MKRGKAAKRNKHTQGQKGRLTCVGYEEQSRREEGNISLLCTGSVVYGLLCHSKSGDKSHWEQHKLGRVNRIEIRPHVRMDGLA